MTQVKRINRRGAKGEAHCVQERGEFSCARSALGGSSTLERRHNSCSEKGES